MRRASFLIALFALASCDRAPSKVAGYTVSGGAPWCAIEPSEALLECLYFSEQHCKLGSTAMVASPGRTFVNTLALCAPRP